ncbi:MAG: GNAT family N-acetyltransferase, partial [Planctomycetaceae bacterium]
NYERKMERAGRTEIEHIRRPNPERTQKLVADLAQIEQQSWLVKSARGKTRFTSPVAQRFWTRLIDEALSPQDRFDAWIIRFNDRPVSFCLTLTALPARYVIANQYDDAVADYRTGSTLYRHMIEEGMARGVRTFDFGDGGIEYKKLWGAEYVDAVDTLLVAPHPLTSRLLPLAHAARQWVKSRRTSTPDPHATAPSAAAPVTQIESTSYDVEETLLSSANDILDTCHARHADSPNGVGNSVTQA